MDASRESAMLASRLQIAWDRRKAAADERNASLDSGVTRPGLLRRTWWRVRIRGDSERLQAYDLEWRKKMRSTPSIVWALSDVFGVQFWLGGITSFLFLSTLVFRIMSSPLRRGVQTCGRYRSAGWSSRLEGLRFI